MPLKHREDGDYELFVTPNNNRILVLNGRKWAAWVQGQAGEILVETDEDHQKDQTLGKGKFMLLDFEDDPKFKDMPHLFLEKDGAYKEMMLPQGWPDSRDKQKKVVETDHELSKDELEEYVTGDMPRGEGEERMKRPGGGSISNVAYHLREVDFPSKARDLIDHASKKGAPTEVIDKLQTLPDRTYENAADVTEEIGEQTEGLPIEDYDKLSVQEAREKVRELSGRDLEKIEEHERSTKNRETVIQAIDAAKSSMVPDDYDEMKADEVIDMVRNTSRSKLRAILDYEKEHQARQSVLRAIEQNLSQ